IGELVGQRLGALLELVQGLALRTDGVTRLGALEGFRRFLHRPLGAAEGLRNVAHVAHLAHELAQHAPERLLGLGAGLTALARLAALSALTLLALLLALLVLLALLSLLALLTLLVLAVGVLIGLVHQLPLPARQVLQVL